MSRQNRPEQFGPPDSRTVGTDEPTDDERRKTSGIVRWHAVEEFGVRLVELEKMLTDHKEGKW